MGYTWLEYIPLRLNIERQWSTPFSLHADAVTGSINFGEGKDAPSPLDSCAGILNNLWGRGTEYELGCRIGPPRYIGWRNWFLGTDSWAP